MTAQAVRKPLLFRSRVLVGTDNTLAGARIRRLLEPRFDVVGIVSLAEELETQVERLEPEVIVADLAVSGRKGLPAVQQLRKRSPSTPVVLLTRTDSTIAIRLGLSSGVQGYVRNEDAGVELVQAVEAALQGQLYLSATSGFKLD